MKSFFSRSLVLSVFVCTFVFGAFVSATEVKAQSDSVVCQTIEALIAAEIILPNKAAAARAAGKCSTPVVPVTAPIVDLISSNIQVETPDAADWIAHGTFKFRVMATSSDFHLIKDNAVNLINVEMNGGVVGKVFYLNVASLDTDAEDRSDSYYICEGCDREFVMSYGIKPIVGQGNYRAKLLYVPFKETTVNVDGVNNPFVSRYVLLKGSPETVGHLDVSVGKPAVLKLIYDSVGREVSLVGDSFYKVTAVDGDVYIRPNAVSYFTNEQGATQYVGAEVRAVEAVEIVNDNNNQTLYKIAEGDSLNIILSAALNPKVLFAGKYTYTATTLMASKDQTGLDDYKVGLPDNTSNKILIVGETSPYIKTVDTQINANGQVVLGVYGERLAESNGFYYCGDVAGDLKLAAGMSNTNEKLFFNISSLKPGDYCSVKLVNKSTGESNRAGFEVPSHSPVSIFWSGGNKVVQIGVVDNRFTNKATRDSVVLGWIEANGKPNGSLVWNGDTVYDVTGTVSWDIDSLSKGPFRILGVTEGKTGNLCFGENGDCNYVLSDSFALSSDKNEISLSFKSNEPIKPTLTLEQKTVNETSFRSGDALLPVGAELLLRWESQNSTNCIASASPAVSTWNGSKSVTGLGSVGKVDVSRTYSLKCNGEGDSVEKKINVFVEGKPIVPVKPATTTPATSTPPVKPVGQNPTLPTNTAIKSAEVYCAKGDWLGKNSVIGIWYKKDLKYNPDPRFMCHTDKNMYRCTSDSDEALPDAKYWNTFSTRIGDGAPTLNYVCNKALGKWVNIKG